MSLQHRIIRVDEHEFAFDAAHLARHGAPQSLTDKKGSTTLLSKYAVSIHTADGGRGDYVARWVSSPAALDKMLILAPRLIGKGARERIGIYEDLKRDIRQFDHMGHGAIDITLWDWAGHLYNASISELLGGYRKRLPAYASTVHGDRAGRLCSKEAVADFAVACHGIGHSAHKIHGWNEGNATSLSLWLHGPAGLRRCRRHGAGPQRTRAWR